MVTVIGHEYWPLYSINKMYIHICILYLKRHKKYTGGKNNHKSTITCIIKANIKTQFCPTVRLMVCLSCVSGEKEETQCIGGEIKTT